MRLWFSVGSCHARHRRRGPWRVAVLAPGSTALKNVLGKEYSITASRGKWIEQKGIKYMPTWHPAALLRDENKKVEFWKDLKEVVNLLNL